MNFWTRLENRLIEKGMNAADLSKYVGVSQPSITGWKNGSYPRADVACKIAETLNTTVEYLVTGKTVKDIPLKTLDLVNEIDSLSETYQKIIINTVKELKNASNKD